MALFVVIALCSSASKTFSQSTENSTQTINEIEIRRIQLVNALERAQTEVKASRKYVAELEKSIKSKQSVIDGLNAKSDKQTDAINSLESDLRILQNAVSDAKTALAARESQVEILKADLKKTREKLGRARTVQKTLIVGLAVAALIAILK